MQVLRQSKVRLEQCHAVRDASVQAEPAARSCVGFVGQITQSMKSISAALPVLIDNVPCRYGDSLKSGWKNVMECVVRLYKPNLLPEAMLVL